MNTPLEGVPGEQALSPSLKLWLAWVLVSTLALFAGLLITLRLPLLLPRLSYRAGASSVLTTLLSDGIAALIGGLVVALLQWIGVRRRISSARAWIGWTVLGWSLALLVWTVWLGFLIVMTLAQSATPVVALGAGTALAGAILGVCQWRALRKTLPRAAWWIPVSGLGWLLGFLIGLSFSHFSIPSNANSLFLVLAVWALMTSMVTGVVLAAGDGTAWFRIPHR